MTTALVAVAASGTADAQAPQDAADGDIIVTAQKRAQSINDVGITISAATGEQLRDRQITSVNDLTRLVPGFTVQESAFNSTSYTLRGVGFFNSDLSSPPTVSVYVDEAPVPYPAMTRLVAFDLERVEVLKGPQGTLYGQNATGGAINYIAAKPTNSFEAGFDLGFSRFNTVEAGGFLSGPISDTLSARVAVRSVRGGDWQKSTTRPGDTLGRTRELQGRFILDWHPSDRFKSMLTVSGWIDRSDSLAAQLLAIYPQYPGLESPKLYTYPIVKKTRYADWTPGFNYAKDNKFVQATWRNDFDLTDDITLTSLTSYAYFRTAYAQDFDGTPLLTFNVTDEKGTIETVSQELRLAGDQGRLKWLLGANYARDKIDDQPVQYFGDNSGAFPFYDCCGIVADQGRAVGHYRVETYGIFGNLEYALTDNFSIQAALRYNNDRRKYSGCSYNINGPLSQNGGTAAILEATQALLKNLNGITDPVIPIGPNDCYVLNSETNFDPVDVVRRNLDQDNISWKLGVNWKPVRDTLVYANVSKGYKAGTFPVVGAALTKQFDPISQESVVAYEAGVKAGLLDRKLQINAAGFYYDYRDKQLRGKTKDVVFGALEALVSIPKSEVYGFEAQAVARPVEGLTLDTSVTYVKSKIKEFTGYDSLGVFGDYAGTPFPYSPKWQSVTDLQYDFPLGGDRKGFLGGTLTYNSKTNSGVGAPAILAIDSYTLLDLRGGIDFDDGKLRLSVWGKNVTGKYRWGNVFLGYDTITRFPARPSTYGVTLSYRYR